MMMRHAGEFPSLSSFCFLFFFGVIRGLPPIVGFIRGNSFPLILVECFPPVVFAFQVFVFLVLRRRLLCFSLLGVMRSVLPPHSLVSPLSGRVSLSVMPEIQRGIQVFASSFLNHKSCSLPLFRPLVEPFGNDASFFVIPEIFNRESKCFQILWTPDRGIQG